MILLMKVGILNQHPLPLFHELYFRQICITAFALGGQANFADEVGPTNLTPRVKLERKDKISLNITFYAISNALFFYRKTTVIKMCTSLIDEILE